MSNDHSTDDDHDAQTGASENHTANMQNTGREASATKQENMDAAFEERQAMSAFEPGQK